MMLVNIEVLSYVVIGWTKILMIWTPLSGHVENCKLEANNYDFKG